MEEKKTSLMKNGSNYGVILGLGLVIFSLILFILNLWPSFFESIIGFILTIGFSIYAAKQYRTKLGGYMSFKESFLLIFILLIIASLIGIIYFVIFFQFINPDALNDMKQFTIDFPLMVGEFFGLDDNALDLIEKNSNKEIAKMTFGNLLKQGIISSIIKSTIYALILGLIMKKNRPVEF